MIVVSVTGAHSSCGKTALGCLLLRGPCKGFGAVKISRARNGFDVVDDAVLIREVGKDTRRLSDAGAARVLWVRTSPDRIMDAWGRAAGLLEGLPGVVVEGNSAVDFANPALVLFVLGANGTIKRSAIDVFRSADARVVNCGIPLDRKHGRRHAGKEYVEASGEIPRPVFFVDLIHGGENTQELLAFTRERLGPAADRGRSGGRPD